MILGYNVFYFLIGLQEYMLCRLEERDPRKCLNEGKVVTACSMKFFQKVKSACAEEFNNLAMCIHKGSVDMRFDT